MMFVLMVAALVAAVFVVVVRGSRDWQKPAEAINRDRVHEHAALWRLSVLLLVAGIIECAPPKPRTQIERIDRCVEQHALRGMTVAEFHGVCAECRRQEGLAP